jgi:hypothetical protein
MFYKKLRSTENKTYKLMSNQVQPPPLQGMPYSEKVVLQSHFRNFLTEQQSQFPELRSGNLYLSNKFGYETIKVFINDLSSQ